MSPQDVRGIILIVLSSGRTCSDEVATMVRSYFPGVDFSGLDLRDYRHCWHCKKRRAAYDSLCHTCYADRTVRKFYQAIYSEWKRTADIAPPQSAGDPTEALPGSVEKLRVFADRLSLGLPLFHPGDAK